MKAFLSGVASLKIVISLHKFFKGKARDIIDILFIPIYLICYPFIVLSRPKDKETYKYKLGICLIVKNEASYIKEWIDYYKLIGADILFIYDNDSTDNLKKILEPYIKSGLVIYHQIPGSSRQLDAYNICIKTYRKDCQYIGFYDIDEFVYLDPSKKLVDIIDDHFKRSADVGGLALNWLIFGSSYQQSSTSELVIERFKYRSDVNFEKNLHIKSIVNPRKVLVFRNPHFPYFIKGFANYSLTGEKVEDAFTSSVYDEVRINHYFTKSKEEFVKKKSKGFADKLGERDMNNFIEHDCNEVFDDSMNPYIAILNPVTTRANKNNNNRRRK